MKHTQNKASSRAVIRAERKVIALSEAFRTDLERIKRRLDGKLDDEAIAAAFPEFRRIADSLFAQLAALEASADLEPAELKQVQSLFRSHRAILSFYKQPFNAAALDKRFSYAGDFEVIDYLLTMKLEASGLLRLYEAYVLQLPAVRAVIERHDMLIDRIREAATSSPPGRPLRIASIGCGSAREFLPLLESGLLENAEIHLVDTSKDALVFAQGLISSKESSARIEYHKEDVVDFYKERLDSLAVRFNGKVDLVYCSGVMDYLTDRIVSESIGILQRTLSPNGVCIVGNFSPDNPSRAYMEWLLDWPLYYRTESDFRRLADASSHRTTLIESFSVAGGVNHFLELKVPAAPAVPPLQFDPDPEDEDHQDEPLEVTESEYEASVRSHRRSVVRGLGFGSLLGALLYPMWILMDSALLRGLVSGEASGPVVPNFSEPPLQYCFWIRTAVMTYLLLFTFGALTLNRNDRIHSRIIWFGAFGHLAMGFGLIGIMWILNAFHSSYHAGLIMVMIVIATLTPWRPIRTTIELLLIATGYVWFALKKTEANPEHFPIVVQNIVFVAGSTVLLCISTYLVPIYKRPKLPPRAVADGEDRARRTVKGGLWPRARIRWAGVRAGVGDLWSRNPTIIGLCAVTFCLLGLLTILVFTALEAQGGDEPNPTIELVVKSLLGVISTVLGGGILMLMRHSISKRTGKSDDTN